jgi:hypothetical protein
MFHDRIKKRMQQMGLKNRVLAHLIGVSAPRLSLYLKGCCQLKPEKRKALDDTLNALTELQRAFPVPIGLDDGRLLEMALERLAGQEFEPFRELTKNFSKQQNNKPIK